MPKKNDCTIFWCIETNCNSYKNGEHCPNCEKRNCCEYCCLQNEIAMNSDSKSDELKCASIFSDIFSYYHEKFG